MDNSQYIINLDIQYDIGENENTHGNTIKMLNDLPLLEDDISRKDLGNLKSVFLFDSSTTLLEVGNSFTFKTGFCWPRKSYS